MLASQLVLDWRHCTVHQGLHLAQARQAGLADAEEEHLRRSFRQLLKGASRASKRNVVGYDQLFLAPVRSTSSPPKAGPCELHQITIAGIATLSGSIVRIVIDSSDEVTGSIPRVMSDFDHRKTLFVATAMQVR